MKKTPRVCGLVLLRSGVSARGPVPCCRGRDAFCCPGAVGRGGRDGIGGEGARIDALSLPAAGAAEAQIVDLVQQSGRGSGEDRQAQAGKISRPGPSLPLDNALLILEMPRVRASARGIERRRALQTGACAPALGGRSLSRNRGNRDKGVRNALRKACSRCDGRFPHGDTKRGAPMRASPCLFA